MNRAYSLLEIKAVDDDARVITGIATTPSADREGDVVEPKGAQFKLPIPFLWQHDHSQPIGQVTKATVTARGIEVTVEVAKVDEPGTLKDRIDEAWQSIKARLVRGLSIGFAPIEHAAIDGTWGRRFSKWEWLELSAVTVPANAGASIQTIKSIDRKSRGASAIGALPVVRITPAGVSAPVTKSIQTAEGEDDMNLQEQIEQFEKTRKAKAARLEEIMSKSAEEGRTLDAAESEEYDTLEGELAAVDSHLKRLRTLEKSAASTAKPVEPRVVNKAAGGAEFRDNAIIRVERSLPKGTAFTRYAMALARSKGNLMQAAEVAKGWAESTPEVETVLKAAVAAGTTTDPEWAAPLVEYQNMTSEFIELLRPQTIVGRIQGLRNVPFNIRMPGQTSGSSVGWVGEGKRKPVSSLAFDTSKLGFTKVAGIVVLTDELVRFSNPSAEALVRSDLTASMAQFLDGQFVDPSVAEVEGVSPASVTNGAASIAATGVDADSLRADVRALFQEFIAANMTPSSGAFIMSNTTALAISMMVTPLGQTEFPGLTMNGGTFFGLPVITSETAGDMIILVAASEILLADDGGVTLDASREASLEMSDSPDGTGTMVSLWQQNMVGLRAERFINWKRRRASAVAYITGAKYGSVVDAGGTGGGSE
ncbi:phage major capsid protein [Pseudomonas urethralis]|uniref:phage major capsid protein n=1 Tax=Pseudomonas urethralis TaxID=2740517 RepID=UPI001596BAD6|nr:phage major capsid protein [Pseudomonas urethralis]